MTEQEKEELFLDFAVKFAEMDKADKRLKTAENNSALKKMSAYYAKVANELKRNEKAYDERGFFKFYGIYNAYLELRHATIYIVNAKKHQMKDIGKLDRLEDIDEAEKVGKILIDAMINYFLEDEEPGKLGDATYYHA